MSVAVQSQTEWRHAEAFVNGVYLHYVEAGNRNDPLMAAKQKMNRQDEKYAKIRKRKREKNTEQTENSDKKLQHKPFLSETSRFCGSLPLFVLAYFASWRFIL